MSLNKAGSLNYTLNSPWLNIQKKNTYKLIISKSMQNRKCTALTHESKVDLLIFTIISELMEAHRQVYLIH